MHDAGHPAGGHLQLGLDGTGAAAHPGACPPFRGLIISDRVGYLKPSAGIFHHALELHGRVARAAIHVGDSVPADVVGARGAGIRPVLIDRATRGHGGRTARARCIRTRGDVPRIDDLWGLVDLLGLDRPVAAARVLRRCMTDATPSGPGGCSSRYPCRPRTRVTSSCAAATVPGRVPGRPLAAPGCVSRDAALPGRDAAGACLPRSRTSMARCAVGRPAPSGWPPRAGTASSADRVGSVAADRSWWRGGCHAGRVPARPIRQAPYARAARRAALTVARRVDRPLVDALDHGVPGQPGPRLGRRPSGPVPVPHRDPSRLELRAAGRGAAVTGIRP